MADGDKQEKGKPRGAASVPPKSSFLLRWLGRLMIVAIGIAAALAYGFYKAPGLDGQPQKKLPWDDLPGFQKYSQDTFLWARAEGEKAATQAKQKIEEIQWGKEADALWAKADSFLGGSSGAATDGAGSSVASSGPNPAPPGEAGASSAASSAGASVAGGSSAASASSGASSRTSSGASSASSSGKPPGAAEGDPAMGPGSTPKPGYYEAYKTGYKSYRDGLVNFRNAKASKSRGKELKAALEKFQSASSSWQKAQELREQDRNLDELMRDLNQYIFECRKQLKATNY